MPGLTLMVDGQHQHQHPVASVVDTAIEYSC